MSLLQNSAGLYSDFYELTMAQGYFLSGKQNEKACFDYFFRKNPFGGGYVIFAGLETLLQTLQNYHFDQEACNYLQSLGFDKHFLEYLKTFRFNGDVCSVREGEVVFPNEPLLRVEGNIVESQLIESLLLNTLNFQSLIATKASRIRYAAGDKLLLEFGLRRAQGLGAIHASRAAIIGGFNKTSNTFSSQYFNLQPSGTMAHSWVQAFENELDAFRRFVTYYPDSAVLLVDTYDTLKSGIPNALIVAKEMDEQGHHLQGIRLDSGDLAYLSKKVRKILDRSGLSYVKIVASNQLDEYVIRSLQDQQAPIDVFGVGTSVATGMGEGLLDGVYKLTELNGQPVIKLSENSTKMTLPGKKHIFRYHNSDSGYFYADGIGLNHSSPPETIYHPQYPEKNTYMHNFKPEDIMLKVMSSGRTVTQQPSIETISNFVHLRLQKLPEETRRFENPHIYKVGISKELIQLRNKIISKIN